MSHFCNVDISWRCRCCIGITLQKAKLPYEGWVGTAELQCKAGHTPNEPPSAASGSEAGLLETHVRILHSRSCSVSIWWVVMKVLSSTWGYRAAVYSADWSTIFVNMTNCNVSLKLHCSIGAIQDSRMQTQYHTHHCGWRIPRKRKNNILQLEYITWLPACYYYLVKIFEILDVKGLAVKKKKTTYAIKTFYNYSMISNECRQMEGTWQRTCQYWEKGVWPNEKFPRGSFPDMSAYAFNSFGSVL